MASAKSDFDPAATASPAARNSATSSRPWRDIHTLCQVSIRTAKPRMLALNISWPLPPKSSDNPLVNNATRQAPKTPAATPPAIHFVRPGTAEVTAMTMPTTRPASKTSRKTISNDASTGTSQRNFHDTFHGTTRKLWDDQEALSLMVEIVVEIIAARLLRPHVNDALAAHRNDLLEMQIAAFEFRHDRVQVLHMDRDRLARRSVQFGGIEQMIFHGDRELHRVIGH